MAEYFMAVFLFNIKCTSGLYLFNQVLYKGPDPSGLNTCLIEVARDGDVSSLLRRYVFDQIKQTRKTTEPDVFS
jgi:hypothetical protein